MTDVIQIKIDDLSTNLCRAHKTTKGTTSRPSCTSLWLVTVQRITAIESRLYGIVCVHREHLLARSMAFIVDDTIVYSHLVNLGADAYFCKAFWSANHSFL